MKKQVTILFLFLNLYFIQAALLSIQTLYKYGSSEYKIAYVVTDLFIFKYSEGLIIEYFLIQREELPLTLESDEITSVSLNDNGKSIIIHYTTNKYLKFSLDISTITKNIYRCNGISFNKNSAGLTKENIFDLHHD